MKMSKGRWEEGRLYRLQSATGQIGTFIDKCACEECDSVVVTFMDDGGDIIEVSLGSEEFEEMVQEVMDVAIARHISSATDGQHKCN